MSARAHWIISQIRQINRCSLQLDLSNQLHTLLSLLPPLLQVMSQFVYLSSAPVSHDDGDRRYLFSDVPHDDSSQLGAPLDNETVPGHERGSLQTVTGDWNAWRNSVTQQTSNRYPPLVLIRSITWVRVLLDHESITDPSAGLSLVEESRSSLLIG